MVRYIPTYDGRGIISLYDEGERLTCGCIIRSIPEAEQLLSLRRRSDEDFNPHVAAIFLKTTNSLADALAYAAELRAKADQAARTAELGEIVERAA